MRVCLFAASATLALALTAAPPPVPSIDTFFDDFAKEWVRGDPELATERQYFTGDEQDRLDRQLTPVSPEYSRQRAALARRGLMELRKFDRGRLTSSQRISASLMEWQLDDRARADAFLNYRFPFNQFGGVQNRLVQFLADAHPLRNKRDAENFQARLEQVAPLIEDALKDAKSLEAKGVLPPKFILTATIAQLERFLEPEPRKNILVTSFEDRASKIAGLAEADRAKMTIAAEATVRTAVYPSYRKVLALLNEQLPKSTDDAGLWRLKGGDVAYRAALRRYTTTDMTADQIHELGLKEVARIEKTMDGLLRQLGFAEGTVKERMTKLEQQSQPAAGPGVRADLLAQYDKIVRDAERRSDSLFDITPKAPVIVRRIPEFQEKNAAAHYTAPAPDGSRPGTFWVPLPGPEFRIVSMRTLAYHEAVPGHHFQVALQAEMKDLPRFRRDLVFGFISAFGEGWGLYAEKLAAESGWYDGDPKGLLGQLDSELFRARRLVVDTGLHAKHWTRQQAIDYGIPVAEVERYVVLPGQACAYKIGELRILELRDKAKRELGDKFSLREFHNTILRTGIVPLGLLESVVNDYISSKR